MADTTPTTTADSNVDSTATTDFSGALSLWRDINLPELQRSLDAQAPSLIDSQKEALLSRKKLAEQTREFKKIPDPDKIDAFKSLLKAYQSEIDALTKRGKAAENAFLGVYGALAKAPDPYPLLEVVVDQTASLTELDALKADNTRLQRENLELKRRQEQDLGGEAERARLAERLKALESSLEARVEERAQSAEAELAARWDERIRNFTEREQDLSKALQVAQEQLRDLRSRDESTTARLLADHQGEDGAAGAKLAELEMIASDLERSNARVASIERRNEQLRAEIEAVRSGRADNDRFSELERSRDELEAQLARLRASLDAQEQKLREAHEDGRKREEEVRKQLHDRIAEADALRAKVSRYADYDEIKRELEIVKYVEFAVEAEDEESTVNSNGTHKATAVDGAASAAKPLEALLMEKNRKLQDELTTMRVQHNELQSRIASDTRELSSLRSEVARVKSLNERLENDLVSLNTAPAPSRASTSTSGSTTVPATPRKTGAKENTKVTGSETGASEKETQEAEADEALAELDRLGQKVPGDAGHAAGGRQSPIPFQPSADSSILPIITSQRDRFRARNAELEEELRKQFETITELRLEVKNLQEDNLGLYEKVRYMQTYGSDSNGAANSRLGSNNRSIASAARTDPSGAYPPERGRASSREDKYRNVYEESMNPFEAFRGREQSRALASLNPLERLLHMLTRLILGHRRMRVLFMLYAVCLHLLVFGMLFEVGHSTPNQSRGIDIGQPLRPDALNE